MVSFNDYCAMGIEPQQQRMAELLQRSLMLVTALNHTLAMTRRLKLHENVHTTATSLRDAAVASDGYLSAEQTVVPSEWSTTDNCSPCCEDVNGTTKGTVHQIHPQGYAAGK